MVKNYFFNLLLTIANLLFPILSFPYVSRVLGPEGIGKAQFAFSFAQYFSLIAALGIPIYGIKEIARYRDDIQARSKVFCELMIIYIFMSICLTAVYAVVIYKVPYFTANRKMYLAAGFMVILSFCFIEWLYSGMEEFKSIALRSVLFKFINLILLYVFVRERADYQTYLYLLMFAFLGNNILSLFLIGDKVKLTFKDLELKKHIVPLLFILGTTLASGMYTGMDTVLLGFLSNSKTVGLYTAAFKLSNIAIPFVTSMAVILIPKAGKDFAEKNLTGIQQTLDQIFRFVIFFGVPITLGLMLLAPQFITLFSGDEFLPATNAMRLLAPLPLIIGFAHLLLYIIMVPSGHNRAMFLCVLGGLITSLSLNILLVPHLNEVGSSIANISSEVVVTTLYFYVINKHFSFKYQWVLLVEATVCAVLFIPVIWGVKMLALPLIYMLFLSISACAGIYFIGQLLIFRNNFLNDIFNFIKLKFTKAA